MLLWRLAGTVQGLMFSIFGLYIMGTPLMRVYLRILGAKVGSNVFWDTFAPVETQGITVEDDAVVEMGAMVLGHVVDHGRLQFGKIHIGKGAVVSSHVNVQPGARLGTNVLVGCLTTVMKHEQLPDNTAWVGSPAVRRRAEEPRCSKGQCTHEWRGTRDLANKERGGP